VVPAPPLAGPHAGHGGTGVTVLDAAVGMQAALASERAGTGSSAEEQAAAPVLALTRAATSGQYPNLAAALAAAGPVRGEDDVFESCLTRLIDVARPGDHAKRPVR
jgi:hypothetical protein